MKYRYLLLVLLVPIAVFAATGGSIREKAIVTGPTPKGWNGSKVQLRGNDSKNLGLNSNAKEFLKSRYSRATMSNGCVKSKDKAINGLDTKFAECAARFFQQWEKQNGRVTITSAYRDAADQACVCRGAKGPCAAPGRSRHQRGTAIDVWPQNRRDIPKFHAAAKAFGGLHFPMGMRDRPHITPSGEQCASGDGASGGQGNTPPFGDSGGGGGAPPSSGEQKPQGGQQQGGGAGAPQGGSSSPVGDGKNPYSKAGGNTDPYGIWKDPVTGKNAQNVASITCDPGTIGGSERSLVEWRCGGNSTRSRGGTTHRESRFNTQGRLTGKGYAHPRVDTRYKVQCLAGDKVVGEAVCSVNISASTNSSNTVTGRSVMHLSAENYKVGWAGSTTLQWATINANNCTLKGGKVRESGSSGVAETGRIYRSTSYMLTCDTTEGSKSKKVEVNIW